jgi:hypothetical protein
MFLMVKISLSFTKNEHAEKFFARPVDVERNQRYERCVVLRLLDPRACCAGL